MLIKLNIIRKIKPEGKTHNNALIKFRACKALSAPLLEGYRALGRHTNGWTRTQSTEAEFPGTGLGNLRFQ